MGLFGNNKKDNENLETKEIKQAFMQESNINDISNTNKNISSQQEFVNPFSFQNQTMPQQTIKSNNQMYQNSNPFENNNSTFIQSQQNNPGNVFEQNSNSQLEQEQFREPQNQFSQYQNQFTSSQQIRPENNQTQINSNIQQSLDDLNYKPKTLSPDEIQEMIDETVEKIIEEKWEKLLLSVEKVVNWKEKQEKEMEEIQKNLKEFGESFEKLDTKLNLKISSYDTNIMDVNAEIKALEKVFQKITPTLVNNVNELAKIADELREIKKISTVKSEGSQRVEEDE